MDSEGIYIVANSSEFHATVSGIFEQNFSDVPIRFFSGSNELVSLLSSPQTTVLPTVIILVFKKSGTDAVKVLDQLKNPEGASPEFLKRIPVIVLIGKENLADVTSCYKAGANAVLSKPESIEALTKSFESICDFWININKGPEFCRSEIP